MNFDLQALSSFSGWERLAQTGISFGTNLLAALAIYFIGRWVATRVVTLMKAALTRAKVDKTLVSFLGNVANIGLLILVIIAALGKLGIPTTSVTALIGGAGLAVALSLKDQLSNFAAGALIILFRPFKVGDFIRVNGFEGIVREIKMVQTSFEHAGQRRSRPAQQHGREQQHRQPLLPVPLPRPSRGRRRLRL